MAVYYFMISILTGMGFVLTENKKNRNNTILYLAASFLILVAAASCRYAIGFDYFSYRNIYEIMSSWSFGNIFHYYWGELFYFILCKIFGMAGCPYQVFLLIVNVFLVAAVMQFIYRYSKLPWVSVYLYITLQFLAYNMNLIRQSIATAFFLLAYPYLKERKLLPFTILMLAGGLFHNSLLFMYPLYFLLPRKNTKKSLLFLALLTFLVYIFFEPLFEFLHPFLPAKYTNYQGTYFWHPSSLPYVFFPILYCLLIFFFQNRIADSFLRTVCTNSALLHAVISLFVTKHFILERFAIYPFVFSLIAIPEIICSYQQSSHNLVYTKTGQGKKPFLTYHRVLLLFLLLGGAYFIFAAFAGFHHVYPYVGLWDKSISTPN